MTGQQTAKPPPVLASARVLAYAILDGSVGFSGRSRVFVESRELGRVPRLVIAEGLEAADVVLLYCDDDWNRSRICNFCVADFTRRLAAERERG